MEIAISSKPRRGRKPGKRTKCLEREEPSSSAPATLISAQSAKKTRKKTNPKNTSLTTVPL